MVGSANSFASEMLKNRMHPQIEKAVRDVTRKDSIIEYAVVPLPTTGRQSVRFAKPEIRKRHRRSSWPDSRGRENYGS